jgi:hydrogenase small subunit
MGCKGPQTHAACSTNHFNEVTDCWPIGAGTPCVGCTEKAVAFRVPIFALADIHGATPPETFPGVNTRTGSIGAAATGLAGLVAGAIGGAAWAASHRLPAGEEEAVAAKANSGKAGDE